MAAAFRSSQRPDSEVVELLERALLSAREGHIRAIAIQVISPVNESESLLAGDLSPIRVNALLGALTRTIHDLAKRS